MLRLLILSILTTNIATCTHMHPSNNSQISTKNEKVVSSQENILIGEVRLQAREEKKLPLGATPNPNRDIGFASVFIRFENPQEADVNLTIKKIEIRNTSDNKVQMVQSSPQKIIFKPLENSEEVFHLTNKTGFSQKNQVKAFITYQIGEQVDVIESKPSEIERF